jgi:hypothetical protein
MDRRSLIAGVLAGLLLVVAVMQASLAAPTSVEIKRAGIQTFGVPIVGKIYWTDNSHVLFIGAKRAEFKLLPDGRKLQKKVLTLWNTETGDIKILADIEGEYVSLCYDRGYVRYGFKSGSRSIVKAGPLEKVTEGPVVTPSRKHFRVNPLTCREYDEHKVTSQLGDGIIPLREEHGYWRRGGGVVPSGMTIYIRKGDEGKEEHILVPISASRPDWSEYAQAYVFGRSEDLFSRTKTTGKMWLLFPDGQTKEFAIPAGPWFGGSTGYGITRHGVFMYSHALVNLGNGDAGGYLFADGQRPERFIEGYIYAFGISPDGCGIALNLRAGSMRRPKWWSRISVQEVDDMALTQNELSVLSLVASDIAYRPKSAFDQDLPGSALSSYQDSGFENEFGFPAALLAGLPNDSNSPTARLPLQRDPGTGADTVVFTNWEYVRKFQDDANGFGAVIYRSKVPIDEETHYIVAMQGSDGASSQDWFQNLDLAREAWEKESSSVTDFLVNGDAQFPGIVPSNGVVHFAGQSLGGGLAQYAIYDYVRAMNQLAAGDPSRTLDLAHDVWDSPGFSDTARSCVVPLELIGADVA